MSAASIVDAQIEHMLKLIDAYRDEQCNTLIDEANVQARSLLKQAYHDARGQVQQAAVQNRNRVREAITSAQAQRETAIRQQNQHADARLLEKAWQLLEQQLLTQWQNKNQQVKWLQMAVSQAVEVLPSDSQWIIHHPSAWSAAQSGLPGLLAKHATKEPTFEPDENIRAGIRICVAGTCVDASLQGLLHNRRRIESRLLAEIRRG